MIRLRRERAPRTLNYSCCLFVGDARPLAEVALALERALGVALSTLPEQWEGDPPRLACHALGLRVTVSRDDSLPGAPSCCVAGLSFADLGLPEVSLDDYLRAQLRRAGWDDVHTLLERGPSLADHFGYRFDPSKIRTCDLHPRALDLHLTLLDARPLAELAVALGAALGCRLERDADAAAEAYAGEVLGLELRLERHGDRVILTGASPGAEEDVETIALDHLVGAALRRQGFAVDGSP